MNLVFDDYCIYEHNTSRQKKKIRKKFNKTGWIKNIGGNVNNISIYVLYNVIDDMFEGLKMHRLLRTP